MTTEELIQQYLYEAAAVRTKAAKLSILGEMSRDPEITDIAAEYLKAVKDPSFNYYLTLKGLPKPKMMSKKNGHYSYCMLGMLTLLNDMSTRLVSGQDQLDVVADYLYCSPPALRTLFVQAIEHQLPGNIGRTLINIVYPNLIYKQPYGGCASWDADKVEKRFNFNKGVILQLKQDGMSLMIDVKHRQCRTRAGQDVSKQMRKILNPIYNLGDLNTVYHVEANMWSDDWREIMPRPESNGEFNAMFQGERQIDPRRVVLTLLDAIPVKTFYGEEKGTVCAEDRYLRAKDFYHDYNTHRVDETPWSHVEIIPMCYVYSMGEARSVVQRWIADGKEGGVLKAPLGIWKSGKMTSQMKMKNEFECTLMVYGHKPHKKNLDWVGSLLCCSLDGILKTAVGSGLNEDEDSELCRTSLGNFYNGMLVEIKAEKISKNNALDLPRIIEVRHDKNQADTYEEVLKAYQDSIALG